MTGMTMPMAMLLGSRTTSKLSLRINAQMRRMPARRPRLSGIRSTVLMRRLFVSFESCLLHDRR